MSTIEDFKNTPIGATATRADGGRAMKVDDEGRPWVYTYGFYMDDEDLTQRGFTLDRPAPTTAREALDLAWELAHEVKEGQVVPGGTRFLEFHSSGVRASTLLANTKISHELATIFRTFDPLPEPEPDWLDALIVLATCKCRGMELWQPHNEKDGTWECAHCGLELHWSELEDVTPLYQKEGQDA